VREGWVDALSSDYVPISLLEGALRMTEHRSLPAAIAMVTSTPAALAGFADRGRIQPGLRADLADVSWRDGVSRIHAVWSGGVRVA
jgi:alpha-D-ribose 1-methylphosphonate 5-triphosphate diphosphatase